MKPYNYDELSDDMRESGQNVLSSLEEISNIEGKLGFISDVINTVDKSVDNINVEAFASLKDKHSIFDKTIHKSISDIINRSNEKSEIEAGLLDLKASAEVELILGRNHLSTTLETDTPAIVFAQNLKTLSGMNVDNKIDRDELFFEKDDVVYASKFSKVLNDSGIDVYIDSPVEDLTVVRESMFKFLKEGRDIQNFELFEEKLESLYTGFNDLASIANLDPLNMNLKELEEQSFKNIYINTLNKEIEIINDFSKELDGLSQLNQIKQLSTMSNLVETYTQKEFGFEKHKEKEQDNEFER